MSLIYKDGTMSAVSFLAKQKKQKIMSKYASIILEDLYEHQLFTSELFNYEEIQYELSRDDNGLFYCKLYLPKNIYYSNIPKLFNTYTFIKVDKQPKYNIVHLLYDKVITFKDLSMFIYDSELMFNSPELYDKIIVKPTITFVQVKQQIENIIKKKYLLV